MTTKLKNTIVGLVMLMCMACDRNYVPPVDDNTPENRPSTASAPSRQERILVQQGYTNIRMTGAPMWGCSDDDSMFASSNFTATAPTGDDVEGTVCCGLVFKGCTVRFD